MDNIQDYRFFNVTYNSTDKVDLIEALKDKGIEDLLNLEKEKVYIFLKSDGQVGILDGVMRNGKLKGFNHFYLKATEEQIEQSDGSKIK